MTLEVDVVEQPGRPVNEVLVVEFRGHADEFLGPPGESDGLLPRQVGLRIGSCLRNDDGTQRLAYTLHVDNPPPRQTGGSYEFISTVLVEVGAAGVGYLAAAAKGRLGKGFDRRLDEAINGIIDEATKSSRPLERPLGREEALERARWKVVSTFGLREDGTLQIVSEEHKPEQDSWMITLRDPDGTQYEVELEAVAGLVSVTRLLRVRAKSIEEPFSRLLRREPDRG